MNNTYWTTAGISQQSLEEDVNDFTDNSGTEISLGNMGVWFPDVLMEGTPEDFRETAAELVKLADKAEADPERWIKSRPAF